ncbi:MAG TPA: response regulator transcription factor [Usitatibacter sp.]|nr:response regulator transcription factor [Usitatibacter sp.]
MIRVVLADDHVLVRAGLRALIEGAEDARVVAEASNGREAIDLAGAHRPDLVLLDVSMPEMNGIDALACIKRASPRSRVIMVSMHAESAFLLRAFRAGADGYLLKHSAPGDLRAAMHAALRGQAYVSPAASRGLLLAASEGAAHESPLDRLSPRQRQVLQLLAEGHGAKSIAYRLGISGKTVEAHRSALKERLAINDLAGLVRFALRHGLVEDGDRLQ